jgi:hypothetical protein
VGRLSECDNTIHGRVFYCRVRPWLYEMNDTPAAKPLTP